jgi:hypothetical protein
VIVSQRYQLTPGASLSSAIEIPADSSAARPMYQWSNFAELPGRELQAQRTATEGERLVFIVDVGT